MLLLKKRCDNKTNCISHDPVGVAEPASQRTARPPVAVAAAAWPGRARPARRGARRRAGRGASPSHPERCSHATLGRARRPESKSRLFSPLLTEIKNYLYEMHKHNIIAIFHSLSGIVQICT